MGRASLTLSQRIPQRYIYQSTDKRQAEYIPCRHRQAGGGTVLSAGRADETGTGYHGASKGGKSA